MHQTRLLPSSPRASRAAVALGSPRMRRGRSSGSRGMPQPCRWHRQRGVGSPERQPRGCLACRQQLLGRRAWKRFTRGLADCSQTAAPVPRWLSGEPRIVAQNAASPPSPSLLLSLYSARTQVPPLPVASPALGSSWWAHLSGRLGTPRSQGTSAVAVTSPLPSRLWADRAPSAGRGLRAHRL